MQSSLRGQACPCPDPLSFMLSAAWPQLGAQCSTERNDAVTHVVATDNTDKTRWAKRAGKFVVNPNWLWCSGA